MCVEHVAEIIQYETAQTVAGIIIEPVVGGGGVIIPPDGYMQRLREICDENDILLIADEVMTGFCRTGEWFGMQNWQVVPDIMTMAKGLTSSYVPLGAVALSDKVSAKLDQEMLYCGLTYSAHPLSCAVASANIEVYKKENLIENSRSKGKLLKEQLKNLQQKHPSVGDVRSLGLFACVELVKNKQTKEPIVPYNAGSEAAAITKEMGRRLADHNVAISLRWMFMLIAPPLCIDEDELRQGLSAIDDVLNYTDTLT
jgi:taurine--2-oxoglutarate transaminase